MFKLITMSDSNYFDAGELFLKTRDVIKEEDIVLYGPDLNKQQRRILLDHNIEYKRVRKKDFQTQMQFMKFELCLEQIDLDREKKKYVGFVLGDFDIFFINNWKHVYKYDFDLGLIVRPSEIKKRVMRAYACGGEFFFKHSASGLLKYAREVILNGGDKTIPEYDRIWKTLESGRPKHKTHYRTTLRWWNDQIFLSCIVLRFMEQNKYKAKFGLEPVFTDFRGYKIAFFNSKYYHVLNSEPVIKPEKNIYVRHLKSVGRKKLVGKDKTVEKL